VTARQPEQRVASLVVLLAHSAALCLLVTAATITLALLIATDVAMTAPFLARRFPGTTSPLFGGQPRDLFAAEPPHPRARSAAKGLVLHHREQHVRRHGARDPVENTLNLVLRLLWQTSRAAIPTSSRRCCPCCRRRRRRYCRCRWCRWWWWWLHPTALALATALACTVLHRSSLGGGGRAGSSGAGLSLLLLRWRWWTEQTCQPC
jgi:hypothetical protein